MFRPKDGHGFGNIIMQLCLVDKVSSHIYDGKRGDYIKVKSPMIVVEDDGTLQACESPPLFIRPEIHKKISHIIEPTEKANAFIEKYKHLIDGVEFAFQIRMGSKSSNPEVTSKSSVHCDETGLNKFFEIMDKTRGNVFISSDCLETKKLFSSKYGTRVRYIDEDAVYVINGNTSDPWITFTDFFLLGMCPFIFMTGGARDMFTFSTFGYMAAMYGQKEFQPIFNDCYDSIHRTSGEQVN